MPGAFVPVRVRWQGPHPTSLPRKRESSGRGSGPCDGDLRHDVGIHASSAWQEIPTTAGCIDTDLHPQVEVTLASQANLSSRSHTCIMQCGSCSLKPAVTRKARGQERGRSVLLPPSLKMVLYSRVA